MKKGSGLGLGVMGVSVYGALLLRVAGSSN